MMMDTARNTGAAQIYLVVIVLSFTLVGETQGRSLRRDKVCHRWNCPCLGSTVTFRPRPGHHTQKRFDLWERAHYARNHTRALLTKMENERFSGNMAHIRSLRNCIDARDSTCLDVHLDAQCRLETLPQIEAELSRPGETVTDFVRSARTLLGTLAVFVERARQDEDEHHSESPISLSDDIQHIEDEGIYRLLCQIQVDFNRNSIPWSPSLSRDLMRVGCRAFSDRAPVDNRNYMVFYTLEKLLHSVGEQMKVVSAKRDHVQEPVI